MSLQICSLLPALISLVCCVLPVKAKNFQGLVKCKPSIHHDSGIRAMPSVPSIMQDLWCIPVHLFMAIFGLCQLPRTTTFPRSRPKKASLWSLLGIEKERNTRLEVKSSLTGLQRTKNWMLKMRTFCWDWNPVRQSSNLDPLEKPL